MELLEQGRTAFPVSPLITEADELAARRSLRAQIAKLERELSNAFVTAYPMGGIELPTVAATEPRLLGLGELERIRDELAERLHAARVTIAERADVQAANRLYLERMLLEPAKYRFARVSRHDIGEPGCGVWQVRPRLGLIGMLMGWWQVKLSSGCPLAWGRSSRRGPLRSNNPEAMLGQDARVVEDRRGRSAGATDHVHWQPGAVDRYADPVALGRLTDPGRDCVAWGRAQHDVHRRRRHDRGARVRARQAQQRVPGELPGARSR
jgi:hypothetical protein